MVMVKCNIEEVVLMNIYFICTGNTCRSPMAEAILKSRNLKNVEVRSAGIYAYEGSAMSLNAKTVLDEQNIKHDHVSSTFNQDDAKWADLILTMTAAHKEMVLQVMEEGRDKVFTLNEYALSNIHQDIQDPYGGNLTVYQQTFEELNEAITELEKKLKMEDTN
ncbi:MAG: low molecular weight protein arginine phosphatase [Solibacillus sp.]|jgi:protein arginine phosphatase